MAANRANFNWLLFELNEGTYFLALSTIQILGMRREEVIW